MLGGFEIVPGSKNDDRESETERRELLMRIGVAGLTIYLNGGSDTRRASREYWAEYARERNIGFRSMGGCMCVIGGDASR